MPDTNVVHWIRTKYIDLIVDLDERGRRRWAAIEARSLGHGGIAAVAEATGLSDRTIRNGLKELERGAPWPPGNAGLEGGESGARTNSRI